MKKLIAILILIMSNACALAQLPPVVRTLPYLTEDLTEDFDSQPNIWIHF